MTQLPAHRCEIHLHLRERKRRPVMWHASFPMHPRVEGRVGESLKKQPRLAGDRDKPLTANTPTMLKRMTATESSNNRHVFAPILWSMFLGTGPFATKGPGPEANRIGVVTSPEACRMRTNTSSGTRPRESMATSNGRRRFSLDKVFVTWCQGGWNQIKQYPSPFRFLQQLTRIWAI